MNEYMNGYVIAGLIILVLLLFLLFLSRSSKSKGKPSWLSDLDFDLELPSLPGVGDCGGGGGVDCD